MIYSDLRAGLSLKIRDRILIGFHACMRQVKQKTAPKRFYTQPGRLSYSKGNGDMIVFKFLVSRY